MLLRHVGHVFTVVLLTLSAGCTSQVSQAATLFFAHEGKAAKDYRHVAEVGAKALSDAQRSGAIPVTVALHHPPDTALLEVVARADNAHDAAQIANAAVDELAAQLNGTDQVLGRDVVVVVSYATG